MSCVQKKTCFYVSTYIYNPLRNFLYPYIENGWTI